MNTQDYIELDLNFISNQARKREDENWRFRSYLKAKDEDKVDRLVHRLNREITARIDCTQCGNCCKSLQPTVNGEDISRLAERLRIAEDEFKEKYVGKDEWSLYLKQKPCSFLRDKKCTVYEDRPEDCRSYPHLHKPEFTSRLFGVIQNYAICPIVFNVVERLKQEMGFR